MSVWTDGSSGIARAGYATDADPASGRAEQDPEAWWGAIGLAVRELVRLDVGEVCRDRDRRPRADARRGRRRRTRDPSRDHLAGHPLHRRGGGARGGDGSSGLEPGRAAGGALAGAAPARRRGGDPLVPRDVGRDRAAPDGPSTTSLVEGQPFPDAAALASVGLPAGKVPEAVRAGTVVGELLPDVARGLGLRSGIPVVAGIVDAWASFHGAGLTRRRRRDGPGRLGGRLRGLLGSAAGRSRVVLDDRAAARPVLGRRGDGRDRTRPRLVPARRARRRRHDGAPDRGGRHDRAGRRRRRLPAVPRRASARRSGTRPRVAPSSGSPSGTAAPT